MFHFSGFDAEATHFDLRIHAAQEIQRAVGAMADQVARLVSRAPGSFLNGSAMNFSSVSSADSSNHGPALPRQCVTHWPP